MARVEHAIDVKVPVRTAYNQWTQFEDYPRFMEGVEEVRQLDDKRLHWRAKIAGKEEQWDATITEQKPDERVAWKSTTGAENAGVVTFHYIDPNTTRVMLQLELRRMGPWRRSAARSACREKRVEGDLKRFKEFIEARGRETGAWRGEIDHGRTTQP